MTKSSHQLGLLLLAMLALLDARSESVRNGSFEGGLQGWTAGEGVRIHADAGRDGTPCAELTGPGVSLRQDIVRETRDRFVALLGWFRSEGVRGSGPRLELVSHDVAGTPVGTPVIAMGHGGTSDWHRVQIVGLIPVQTARLLLRVHGPGEGRAVLDDVRIVQGSRAIRRYLVESQSELIPTQEPKRSTCYRTPTPIVPDGDLSDWARVPADSAIAVGGGGWYGAGSDYGGAHDASMLVYTLWDDQALYLAALVTDDHATALDGHQPDDETVVVIMYVDDVLRTGYDLLCYFPIHEMGETRCTRLPLGRKSDGRAFVAERDGHLVLEAEFPLSEIVAASDATHAPFAPADKRSLRFDVGMYDSDTVKREHKPIWNTRTSWNQPAHLGWLDFETSPPPWKPGDRAVGAAWAEDVVAPYRPAPPCPRLGPRPVDLSEEEAVRVKGLREELRGDPDRAERIKAFAATYKQYWRPQIDLAATGRLPPEDVARAQLIAQRLLEAYAASGDETALALWAETTAVLRQGR